MLVTTIKIIRILCELSKIQIFHFSSKFYKSSLLSVSLFFSVYTIHGCVWDTYNGHTDLDNWVLLLFEAMTILNYLAEDSPNDLDNQSLSLYGLLGQQRLYSVSLMASDRTTHLHGSEKSLSK